MFRKSAILIVMVLLSFGLVSAQTVTTPGTDDGTASSVVIFVVICENQAVMNLSGTMEPGFDIYYQIFAGSQGSGEALTALRRVEVNGEYAFSERIEYSGETTIPFGSIGSAYVTISREGAPDSSAFNEYVDDVNDGCNEPQNPVGTSTDTGSAVGDGTGVETVSAEPIFSPFGGFVNPGYNPPANPADFEYRRHETPGIIFAECNDYPVAEPGLVYDTDQVVIFWSWFARTPELVQEHIDNVNYSVTYYQTVPLPFVIRSDIQQRDNNYWVFYYAPLGNLLPGQYFFEYKVWWDRAISDGYADFGPGTENEILVSGCGFNILPNPEGTPVSHNSWPYRLLP